MKQTRPWPGSAALLAASLLSMPLLASDGLGSDQVRSAAQWSAVADSVTSYAGHAASGGLEANPLVNTSPAGLLGLLVLKLGLIGYVDSLPERQRLATQREMASLWSGMSANNLAIAAGATSALALPVGVLAGALVYRSEALQPTEAVRPLPSGLRASAGDAVGRMQVLVVRRADRHGKRNANAPLELALIASGEPVAAAQAVYRPDGSKHFIERLLGEIGVTSEAYAHAMRRAPAGNGGNGPGRTPQELVIAGWRYTYAVRQARADGSIDVSKPEEQIVVEGNARPGRGQKLLLHSDGRSYRILRQIAAYPVLESRPGAAAPTGGNARL